MWEVQQVVTKSIVFMSTIMFTYYAARSLLLLRGNLRLFNRKLARDLEWGRIFVTL